MRRFASPVLTVSVLLALVGVGCGSSNGTKSPADAVATQDVTLKNQRFNPADIVIKAGQTVTWTWDDGDVAHDVRSADDDEKYGSKVQTSGTFTHTFARPGTYPYFCSIHPNMKGTVRVS